MDKISKIGNWTTFDRIYNLKTTAKICNFQKLTIPLKFYKFANITNVENYKEQKIGISKSNLKKLKKPTIWKRRPDLIRYSSNFFCML